MKFFKPFSNSFKDIRKHPYYFALSIVVDIIFFIVLGMAVLHFTDPIMDKMLAAKDILQSDAAKQINFQDNPTNLEGFGYLLDIIGIYQSLVSDFAYLILVLILLWIAFQSLSWWACYKIAGSRKNFFVYLASFTGLTLVFGAILGVIYYGSFNLLLKNMFSPVPLVSKEMIVYADLVLTVVVMYFYSIAISIDGSFINALKNSFVDGTKKILKILPKIIILLIILAIPFVFMYYAVMSMMFFVFIILAIISVIAVTYAKITLIEIIKN